MRKFVFALVCSTCLSVAAYCAEARTPEQIAGQFFDALLKGRNADAIDLFMGANPVLKRNTEQVERMKAQLSEAVRIYGPPFAVELVFNEDLTPSLQRRVYLTKHPSHPLVWEMYFYKAKSEWIPDQLVFLDQYQAIGRKK